MKLTFKQSIIGGFLGAGVLAAIAASTYTVTVDSSGVIKYPLNFASVNGLDGGTNAGILKVNGFGSGTTLTNLTLVNGLNFAVGSTNSWFTNSFGADGSTNWFNFYERFNRIWSYTNNSVTGYHIFDLLWDVRLHNNLIVNVGSTNNLSPFILPGSNVTFDTNGDNSITINASGGGSGSTNLPTGQQITSPAISTSATGTGIENCHFESFFTSGDWTTIATGSPGDINSGRVDISQGTVSGTFWYKVKVSGSTLVSLPMDVGNLISGVRVTIGGDASTWNLDVHCTQMATYNVKLYGDNIGTLTITNEAEPLDQTVVIETSAQDAMFSGGVTSTTVSAGSLNGYDHVTIGGDHSTLNGYLQIQDSAGQNQLEAHVLTDSDGDGFKLLDVNAAEAWYHDITDEAEKFLYGIDAPSFTGEVFPTGGVTQNFQIKQLLTTNTLCFTNGILMNVTTP